MMIPMVDLKKKYRLDFRGVLHVGAHHAEEAVDYTEHGIAPVWWIEANPDLLDLITGVIAKRTSDRLIQALVYDQDGVDLGFNITNNDGMSSSIFEFGTHAKCAPQCVFVERKTLTTSRIDTLDETYGFDVNTLVMDLQGAELYALRGAENLMPRIEFIITEINFDELYKGCVRAWELDEWLGERGFVRAETHMAENYVGWGDALYIRRPA